MAEVGESVHHLEAITFDTPAPGTLDVGECVEDRVDIRADIQAVDDVVVTDVHDDVKFDVVEVVEAARQSCTADASRQNRDIRHGDITVRIAVVPDSLHNVDRMSSPQPVHVSVLAAIIARTEGVSGALDAVRAQVYEPDAIIVVGGGPEDRKAAEEAGVPWVDTVGGLSGHLSPSVTHIWVLHDDAKPRPDALGWMVEGAERTDASVVGAKLLKAEDPTMLEFVGAATDVYCTPYTGLDEEERDQEQYDVVRDVAYVSGACMLVRRDLFMGLGGPDVSMAPNVAGIDFSLRAHVAGGRVVVVPSAEVLHERACADRHGWRERGGQIRAMVKSYQWFTLVWALPMAFLSGLTASLIRTFTDRRRDVLDFMLAWAWNVRHLSSTLRGRTRTQKARLVGDEEIFRYQVKGSAELRDAAEVLGERLRERSSEGRLTELVDKGRAFWQQPGFIAALAAVLFVLLATRSIWTGSLPVTGFSLPMPASAWATLQSYAGGWNPAGLGSAAPQMPVVGLLALLQLILFSKAGLTTALASVAAMLLGVWGSARLLYRLDIRRFGRVAGALVLVGGPAALVLGNAGSWPGLLALGVLPWTLEIPLRPWPAGWRRRLRIVALLGLTTGVLAMLSPIALAIPITALLVGALVQGKWSAVLLGLVGAALAVPLLLPWLYTVAPETVLRDGPAIYWDPSVWIIGIFAATALFAVVFADRERAMVAGWGAIALTGGGVVARTAGLGWGHDMSVAGLLLAALGSAMLAGAAVDAAGRLTEAGMLRRMLVTVGSLGGIALAVGALLLVVNGRMGLGEDRFRSALEFTSARAAEEGVDRVLLAGPPETLPGTVRLHNGFGYRIIGGSVPTLPEARLAAPQVGDDALAAVIDRIETGEELRPGAALADFGVRWVVLTGPTTLGAPLETQLDMKLLPIPGSDYTVYESEVASPRALTTEGVAWRWDPPYYRGPSADRVVIRENAHPSWGTEWQQVGWANEVSGASGQVGFNPNTLLRTMAWVALGYLLLLTAGVVLGRRSS